MQSHEERADQMLRMMGGSMTIAEQRIVLRRLILAEDGIQEYKELSRQQQASLDTLARMQEQHMRLRQLNEMALLALRDAVPDSCACVGAKACDRHELIADLEAGEPIAAPLPELDGCRHGDPQACRCEGD